MKIPKHEAPKVDFTPSKGTHNAVCVGGWHCGEFPPFKEGGKNKASFRVMFELDEILECPDEPDMHGKRKTIVKEWNVRTWNDGSNFFKDIVGWIGRELTEEELNNFTGFTLRGIPAMVSVVHDKGADGKIYANIGNIVYPPKGMPLLSVKRNMVAPAWIIKQIDKSISPIIEKTRLKDFANDPTGTGSAQSVHAEYPDDLTDEDLPF